MGSLSSITTAPAAPERPRLELSGPVLSGALQSLVTATDAQGGIETWIEAVKLKHEMFRQALEPVAAGAGPDALPLETFKNLCAFIAPARRRVAPWLEQPHWEVLVAGIGALLRDYRDTATTDHRLAEFTARFPADREHRWVRDLGAELLHGLDAERYPLMGRWVWDRAANSGVIREIWFDDAVDHITIDVPDGYETFIMLREELSQFLTDNGVFRDVIWYVDLLCASIYARYIASQGGAYLRADFSAPDDPLIFTRRMLGLDGVRTGSQRTRLKSIDGESYVLSETDAEAGGPPSRH